MPSRFAAKWKLIQLLYRRDWDRQRIIALFRVLDWLLWLPEDFSDHKAKYQQTRRGQTNAIHHIERIGIKKGHEVGLEEGLERGLEQGIEKGRRAASTTLQRLLTRKFGEVSPTARTKIEHASLENLETWTDQILDAKSVDDIFVSTDFKH